MMLMNNIIIMFFLDCHFQRHVMGFSKERRVIKSSPGFAKERTVEGGLQKG